MLQVLNQPARKTYRAERLFRTKVGKRRNGKVFAVWPAVGSAGIPSSRQLNGQLQQAIYIISEKCNEFISME